MLFSTNREQGKTKPPAHLPHKALTKLLICYLPDNAIQAQNLITDVMQVVLFLRGHATSIQCLAYFTLHPNRNQLFIIVKKKKKKSSEHWGNLQSFEH